MAHDSHAMVEGVEEGASYFAWISFNAMILMFLILDIKSNTQENTTVRRAAILSAMWIGVALCFSGILCVTRSGEDGLTFLVGYLVEKSLSVDNLLVILLIFKHFKIKPGRQPRVLKWGIFGAIVMRAAFIFAGIAVLERFEWAVFVFGGMLIYAAVKMLKGEEEEEEECSDNSIIVQVLRVFMPYTTDNTTTEFFVRTHQTRQLVATPMFAALLVIEASDVIFAVDSIPCILGLTHDLFLVYTSNMLAILGLRSLYILLADMLHRVQNLQTGLGLVLLFVGVKMMLAEWVEVPQVMSLGIIVVILAGTVALGGIIDKDKPKETDSILEKDLGV